MLFENNKYSKWYNSIVQFAKNRLTIVSYSEKHHIVPKSIGGTNNKENLVILTAREHFVCHLLLTKMTTGNARQKMIYAFWQLSNQKNSQQQRHRSTSKTYEMARKMFAEAHSANMKQNHPLKNEANKIKHQIGIDKRGPTSVKGVKRSEASKEKMRNKIWTEKAIQSRLANCIKNAEARKGKTWSDKKRQSTLNTYLQKNLSIALQIIALYDSGQNNLQISKQLNISWDKVKYSLLHRKDFESYQVNH
jgi:hypothetical protein